jgi:hypothetical protein
LIYSFGTVEEMEGCFRLLFVGSDFDCVWLRADGVFWKEVWELGMNDGTGPTTRREVAWVDWECHRNILKTLNWGMEMGR